MPEKAFASFDTSAINGIATHPRSEEVIDTLKQRFHIRMLGNVLQELYSTTAFARRKEVVSTAASMLCDRNLQSDCLLPHEEVLSLLTRAYVQNPWGYTWHSVDVRDWDYHDEFKLQSLIADDELSSQQRAVQRESNVDWKRITSSYRAGFEALFQQGQVRPKTFEEALRSVESAARKGTTTVGCHLFRTFANRSASRFETDSFLNVCPPFQAAVLAVLLSLWDNAMVDPKAGERFKAGAQDLFMSPYLSYCDVFVTADNGQFSALSAIAKELPVSGTVKHLDDLLRDL